MPCFDFGTMDIRILPSSIANVIAAGEVVERPASVVKELMENAVDAGADNIAVVISDSGRTLIQVIDNGCGMSPDEAVLCFERHATSKIATAEDLMDIHTFGFRGEALAAIAAVSEVTLKTRREEDEVGCEVCFADSVHRSTEMVAAPKGSNFAVRNLFYNVPARRKFIKSPNVELKHIISEFNHVALTRPDVAFSLTHNGKDIYVLKAAMSLKYRIQDLLGSGVAGEVVDISAETSVVKLTGYIGRPDQAKKSLGNQYFFVNGRYFRSPYLHKAVMKGYENLIPEGVTPSYFIYLEVDPHSVDVNISPRKTEVKFEDDSVIFQIIYACIRETLGKNSFGDSIDFDREGVPDIPVIGKNFEEYRPAAEPAISFDPGYNPFNDDGFPSEPQHFQNSIGHDSAPSPVSSGGMRGGGVSYSGMVDKSDNYGKLFEDRTMPSKSVIIMQGKYILTEVKSGILAVNIRRAKERILYERFLKAISANSHITQTALFPVSVYVGAENMPLFEEHSALLSSVGFDISPFGKDTVVVNGVPEGYSVEEGKVRTVISDIMLVLSDGHSDLPEIMASSMAEKFAKIGAAEDDPVTSTVEAQRLIDTLFACENAEFTSSGHRTMAILTTEEMDKKFN